MTNRLLILIVALGLFTPALEAKPKHQVRRADGRFAPKWFHFGLPVVEWKRCPVTPDKMPLSDLNRPWSAAHPITGRY
jgi:hypothetical protein